MLLQHAQTQYIALSPFSQPICVTPAWQYTDIVLKGDFVITLRCHDEGGGGDGYIFIGFHEKSYTKYTHARLNGNGGFASAAYWGAYSVPGNKIDVSFDGLNGKESTKYVPKESAGTYYWSWVRKGDTMYTYDSAKAPGNADVTKVMKHRYTFKKKYTGDLRFGFFLHDKNDFVEIYSPGTKIGPSPSGCASTVPKCKSPSMFNSFGIVSGVKAPKANSLTAYKGKSPSGSNGKQYTKAVSSAGTTRTGGYTVRVRMGVCRSGYVVQLGMYCVCVCVCVCLYECICLRKANAGICRCG